MNEVFFDPTSNTQIHVSDTTITNTLITYPYMTFQDQETAGMVNYFLEVTSDQPYNFTVSADFNVTYFDQNDTSITALSDSW